VIEHNVRKLHPPQSKSEKYRDTLLVTLDRPIFQIIGIINLIIIIIDGAFFFFLLCGWHRLCFEPKRTDCNPRNDIYNIMIQILNVYFTYMAIISMPWHCTNLVHRAGLALEEHMKMAKICTVNQQTIFGFIYQERPAF